MRTDGIEVPLPFVDETIRFSAVVEQSDIQQLVPELIVDAFFVANFHYG